MQSIYSGCKSGNFRPLYSSRRSKALKVKFKMEFEEVMVVERGEEEWNRFRSCTAQEELEKGREEKGSMLIFWGKHKVGVLL